MAFLLVGSIICARGLVAVAPDRHLVKFDHSGLVGHSLLSVEETVSVLGLNYSQARFYVLAGSFCDYGVVYSCLWSSSVNREDWAGMIAACEWECVFVRASRNDVSHGLWLPVIHRYEYLFVLENGAVVSSFGSTETWMFPLVIF
jgi:hypothetical protein